MSIAALIREEVARAEVGSWFTVRDLGQRHGQDHAVGLALTRLAHAGDLVLVSRGLYWKGIKTQFGTTKPDGLNAALAVANTAGFTTGVGPTGWSASHFLGLSTQIPAETHVAIAGRPPVPPRGVRFHQRALAGRAGLGVFEVALLEILRQFPHQVEADWETIVDRIRNLSADGQVDISHLLKASQRERHPQVRELAKRLAHVL